MRNLFIALFLCLFALPMSAKQVITMTNGTEVEAEILTIGTEEISYKKASNPQGPTYVVKRSDVFFIIHEDGTKEVITSLNSTTTTTTTKQTGSQTNGTIGGLVGSYANNLSTNNDEVAEEVPPTNYFPKISVFPKFGIGIHATPTGDDTYSMEWGGLYTYFDANVLFPISNKSAWSVGLGWCELGGDMTASTSKKDIDMGSFTANYLTIPLEWWYRGGDHFMAGFGLRSEILVSQKCEGEKVEDVYNTFREAVLIDLNACFGNFNLGLGFDFNLGNAFQGEGLDWSPTIGMTLNLGYYF
ncbi:MAG: hypothetical protein ACI31A_07390 [Candidatus Limisoma sp.]